MSTCVVRVGDLQEDLDTFADPDPDPGPGSGSDPYPDPGPDPGPGSDLDADPGPDPVARALADDPDAGFVDLFETYRDLVYSVALRLSRRPADAEDLTAETFLRAFRALQGYDRARIEALQLRPWLVTIAMNLIRNRWRTDSRKPPPTSIDAVDAPADDRPGAEEVAAVGETRRDLARLLDALPQVQRTAVVLRHVVDLPISEIAQVLEVPPGTAKSHISRGLQRLRTAEAEQGGLR